MATAKKKTRSPAQKAALAKMLAAAAAARSKAKGTAVKPKPAAKKKRSSGGAKAKPANVHKRPVKTRTRVKKHLPATLAKTENRAQGELKPNNFAPTRANRNHLFI